MNHEQRFSNLATNMISKWFDGEIDTLVNENSHLSETELSCLLSETIENKIKEELIFTTEGYISEMIHNSFEDINYVDLVRFYKD